MSVVVATTMALSEGTANVVPLLPTLVAIVMSFVWAGWSTGTARSGRSCGC